MRRAAGLIPLILGALGAAPATGSPTPAPAAMSIPLGPDALALGSYPVYDERGFVIVRPCFVGMGADLKVVEEIRRAGADVWRRRSPRYEDEEAAAWAHRTFPEEEVFLHFLVNWANVETGGSFDAGHLNVSGGQELNVGVFQINLRWAVGHTYGHDSNPKRWGARDALDPYKATHWALYHLIGFFRPARGDIVRMLDGYWHGTLSDRSPYARGVLRGRIIGWSE